MVTVFGAGGKVGGAAARELRRRGLPVRAVLRDHTKIKSLAEVGCEIAMADLRDVKATKTALEGASSALVICPMSPRAQDALAERYITMVAGMYEAHNAGCGDAAMCGRAIISRDRRCRTPSLPQPTSSIDDLLCSIFRISIGL